MRMTAQLAKSVKVSRKSGTTVSKISTLKNLPRKMTGTYFIWTPLKLVELMSDGPGVVSRVREAALQPKNVNCSLMGILLFSGHGPHQSVQVWLIVYAVTSSFQILGFRTWIRGRFSNKTTGTFQVVQHKLSKRSSSAFRNVKFD